MKTTIPGIKAKHMIISDACREKGDYEALGEAVAQIDEAILNLMAGPWPKGKGTKFHLVLTVEYEE